MLTHKEYEDRFNDKWGSKYSLLSKYKKSTSPVLVRHNECGKEYNKQASEALRYGCKDCARKKSLNKAHKMQTKKHKKFIKDINELVGDEYTVLSKYKNSRTPVKIKHNVCGKIYKVRPTHFLQGRRCMCTKNKTFYKDLQKELDKKYNNEFEILETGYITLTNKTKVKHNKCGHVYDIEINKLLDKKTCYKCGIGTNMKTHADFINEVKEIWKDEFEVLSKYKGTAEKVLVRHKECGNKYWKWPETLNKGFGCKFCSPIGLSSGVKRVTLSLNEIGMDYRREIKFNKCKNVRKLPFDFGIFDDEQLLFLIEYDGEQHFKPSKLFGGKKELELIKKRDQIKNEYCEENDLNLLRIRGRGKSKEEIKQIIEEYISKIT